MSWRVVVISSRCKLEYRLGYMVCRGEETKKIFLDEISTLIVESTSVAITSALLCELVKNKINVIFCDEKHNPSSQLLPLYGRHDNSGMVRKQLSWRQDVKNKIWREIVKNKIYQQHLFMKDIGSDKADLLLQYMGEITDGDKTNREGHSAKVYFNAIFGMDFKRGDLGIVNSALNYGYAILLSAFNREIVADGYLTQIGICHSNEFNHFNLGCDLMEPFRILVDRVVFSAKDKEFNGDYKRELCNLLNMNVKIGDKTHTVCDAIGVYTKKILSALSSESIDDLVFYDLL